MLDMASIKDPNTSACAGWMYNVSFAQFLDLFDSSVLLAKPGQSSVEGVEALTDVLTYKTFRYMNRMLFQQDRMAFKTKVAFHILQASEQLTDADFNLFLKAGGLLDAHVQQHSPFAWLPEKSWLNILQLSRHQFGQTDGAFYGDIIECITHNEAEWRTWFMQDDPESRPLPDYEKRLACAQKHSAFLRLVILRCLREDRASAALNVFVQSVLGKRFVGVATDLLSDIYLDSSNRKPVLHILTSGVDPFSSIQELAQAKQKFPVAAVSMGQGQQNVARKLITAGFVSGDWIVVQNCHMCIQFMKELEHEILTSSNIHEDFRLWIMCEATDQFPIGLLHIAVKVALDTPSGVKAGLQRIYSSTVTQELLDKVDNSQWRALVYVQSFLHAVSVERRSFGSVGWCAPYEFSDGDLHATLQFLGRQAESILTRDTGIDWKSVQHLISEVFYGGRISDTADHRIMCAYVQRYFTNETFTSNFKFNDEGVCGQDYPVLFGSELQEIVDAIDVLPRVDSASTFGLCLEAGLLKQQQESSRILSTIKNQESYRTQDVIESIVIEKCADLLARIPPSFSEAEVLSQLGAVDRSNVPTLGRGFSAPLRSCLVAEILQLQDAVDIVKSTLQRLMEALTGNSQDMAEELTVMCDAIFDGRVPLAWTRTPTSSASSLGRWFAGLLQRWQFFHDLLQDGPTATPSYWLAAFVNPRNFLTSICQQVVHINRSNLWALDDVRLHAEVIRLNVDELEGPAEDGHYIHGLFLEGANWDISRCQLDDVLSSSKVLACRMPVMLCKGVLETSLQNLSVDYGPYGPFECFVYRCPARCDSNLIFDIKLRSEKPPSFWTLRGCCILLQDEE
eukprot:TRINITY_DN25241_c1_g1_i2.p1 TRINITY_DN25241_c1_g1~~TRINITY_DN25241_c1_g1_i2.p1  ORF type:complete len:985 (+),score=107.84 TRINITY_DN25241_c1_g1_i2:410-2956(+)